MATRIQRATPYVWCGVIALVGVAVGIVAAPHIHHGLDGFTVAVLAMAGLAVAAACIVAVEPAWILTGGLLLSVFSGNWGNLGVPVPLDRVAIVGGLLAVAVAAWRQPRRGTDRDPHRPLADAPAHPVRRRVGGVVEHVDQPRAAVRAAGSPRCCPVPPVPRCAGGISHAPSATDPGGRIACPRRLPRTDHPLRGHPPQ